MMFDISEQLFPNLITVIVQLCATGVIFLLYKKYLHKPVLKLMDRKANDFQKQYEDIKELKDEQVNSRAIFEKEKLKQEELLMLQKERMLKEIDEIRKQFTMQMQQERTLLLEQSAKEIEQERIKMISSVEKHVLDVSVSLVEKVLEGYVFDEEQIIKSLETEINNNHVRS